jgi:hypothetical protein
MFSQPPLRQILTGNGLLLVCCGFYLAWWVIAFKPQGAVRGLRSGWLLIPAFLAGVLAVIWILHGCVQSPHDKTPVIPTTWIVCGGIVLYLVLAVVTSRVLHRPITTELFLIIGWAMLALAEVNALHGLGAYPSETAVPLAIAVGIVGVVCLVCYIVYYRLSDVASYIDGMIPLLLAGATMAVFTALARA